MMSATTDTGAVAAAGSLQPDIPVRWPTLRRLPDEE
jgi:hypothetical protein